MKRAALYEKLNKFGEAIITWKNPKTKKVRNSLCTLNFNTTYIKNKTNKNPKTLKNIQDLRVFSYNEGRFIYLDPTNVLNILPLTKVLKKKYG